MRIEIVVYGTRWCGDCVRTRIFLNKIGVPYHWVNIDQDIEGEQLVLRINNGMRSVPTIIFTNGDVLVEPSNTQLQHKLSLLNLI